MSQNNTVSWRRSPRGSSSCSRAPQPPQNFDSAGFSKPHIGHAGPSWVPQLLQKRSEATFSLPQRTQVTTYLASARLALRHPRLAMRDLGAASLPTSLILRRGLLGRAGLCRYHGQGLPLVEPMHPPNKHPPHQTTFLHYSYLDL